MKLNNKIIILQYVLIFIALSSFILGFILNENSAGGGGYNGDMVWIQKNIKIFEENNLISAILSSDLFGNRTPLIYILNTIINPFFFDIEKYRIFVFVLSFIGFFIFYLALNIKYKNTDKISLLLIASILLLSPYYRTSSYWALNENYGLISAISCSIFLNLYLKQKMSELKKYFYIFIITLISSVCVYFDQKLLIIPLICFLIILFKEREHKIKIFTIISYLILALPLLFLFVKWGGMVPPKTQINNSNTITNISRLSEIYFINIGYATTMIAFYLFPLIIFNKKKILHIFIEFFNNKMDLIIFLFAFIFVFLITFFFDFKAYTVDDYWIGLGVVNKLSDILFNNILYKKIFTYLLFIISWLVILIYIRKNYSDLLIIFYYFFISVFLWPLMQEYFDPSILLLALLFFKTKIIIDRKTTLIIFTYFLIFLIVANIHYNKVLATI